jgi:S-disulfanyl-L-cysteine oxidoreductase SoxD
MSLGTFGGRGRLTWRGRAITLAVVGCCLGVGGGCKATPPGKMETALVTRAKHWVTVGNRSEKNPLQATAENIAEGKASFSHYCVACHGLDGQNTGVPFAETMAPPVPSLASADVQTYADGQLKSIIDNGIFPSGMPASKGILTDEEIWGTVLYIRHLPVAGSLGEPAMYSGDEGQESGSDEESKTAQAPGSGSKSSKKSKN